MKLLIILFILISSAYAGDKEQCEKEIKSITLDPHWETADINPDNNHFPRKPTQSRFELFKRKRKNLMREYSEKLKPKTAKDGSQ